MSTNRNYKVVGKGFPQMEKAFFEERRVGVVASAWNQPYVDKSSGYIVPGRRFVSHHISKEHSKHN